MQKASFPGLMHRFLGKLKPDRSTGQGSHFRRPEWISGRGYGRQDLGVEANFVCIAFYLAMRSP